MAQRKKYPKLPNGFGSIRYLKGNRRNPYCVQPASQGLDINGCPIRPKPLCYVDSWYKGFAVLTAYNAGTYTKGMERSIVIGNEPNADNMADLVRMMLNNYSLITQRITGEPAELKKTFKEVYEEFFDYKFVQSKKVYSRALKSSITAAFKLLSPLHSMNFKDVRYEDMQKLLDDCPLKSASVENMLSLLRQMYKYAELRDMVDKDYSKFLKINRANDDEHGVPFTDEDIAILWSDKDNPIAEMLLIMIYSGHRINEYKVIDVDLEARSFTGGIKTQSSKTRVVPIHSAILPLVKKRLERDGVLLSVSANRLRQVVYPYLESKGIERHTPHDTRHTFSRLCDKYGVRENDKKRMLGHVIGDITNDIYGHRELEDLRGEIEKIKVL